MEQNNNQPAPQAPEISESEMKMPEDQFGDRQVSEPVPSHSINPLLIVALILLLTILAVVVIWGEELVGMFLPETIVELEPLPEEVERNETDLNEMENEINQIDLSTMEAELDMMEAEMNAELEAESETEI